MVIVTPVPGLPAHNAICASRFHLAFEHIRRLSRGSADYQCGHQAKRQTSPVPSLQCAAPERAPDRRLNAADRPRAAWAVMVGLAAAVEVLALYAPAPYCCFQTARPDAALLPASLPLRLFNLFSGLGFGFRFGLRLRFRFMDHHRRLFRRFRHYLWLRLRFGFNNGLHRQPPEAAQDRPAPPL